MPVRYRSSWSVLALLLLIAAVVVPQLQRRPSVRSLTVYCAHDAVFADEIIRRFEAASGITVDVVYDEEASKSLGLTNRLIAERDQPRCDVFWNNQTLGTIRLRQQGLLAPCQGAGWSRIPAAFRDPEGYWTGFAARLRVYVIHTDQMPVTEAAVSELLLSDQLQRVAIAVPLYGTTLTHYCVLAGQQGLDGLQAWHRALHARGIREARGNGAVRDLVAAGACSLGFTDTDDVFVALDQGQPVQMLPVRLEGGQTIVIPNSVAMLRDCPHPAEAREFIEFLLSEDTELRLAQSQARQVPLGPVSRERLPAEVRELATWAQDGIAMDDAARLQEAVLQWLSAEYVQQ